jgi:Zn-dependent protease
VYTRFWWGNLREKYHLGDPGLDGRIILRWIFRKWGYGLDQAGSRYGQVAALVNAVMSLQVPHKMRGF